MLRLKATSKDLYNMQAVFPSLWRAIKFSRSCEKYSHFRLLKPQHVAWKWSLTTEAANID